MPRRRRDTTTASSAAPTPDAVPELRPVGDQVLVRMYGQGLGDCFLLAFPRTPRRGAAARRARERPVYVLIDCGVIGGTPDGPERMKAIVRDIRQTTRDDAILDGDGNPRGHLDLLIITHEHWDHVSGFVQAEQEWEQIQVDALWTAWTEKADPSGLPGVLKRILDKQRRALAEVSNRALRFGLSDRFATVLGLMSFFSDAPSEGRPFAARGTDDAWANAKKLVRPEQHTCCEPGEVRRLPGTAAIAYVLGPPRHEAYLRQLNPRKRDRETYEQAEPELGQRAGAPKSAAIRREAAAFADVDPALSLRRVADGRSALNAFAMPLLGPTLSVADGDPTGPRDGAAPGTNAPDASAGPDVSAERDAYDRSFPFDRSVRVPFPTAEATAVNLPADYPVLASYFDDLNHWRRIDFDWLGSAEAFALQADNLTNNTSLVLAFELPAAAGEKRKVLLFPGDAQVGSWLSWDEIEAWQPQAGVADAQEKPDIADLLKRTVFYKVGHHGSHNATLKARGVERMGSPDTPLTAFVAVSPMVAREIKDWCHLPLKPLLDALAQRTRGRVVLPDGTLWPHPAADPPAQPPEQWLQVSPARLPRKTHELEGQTIEIEGEVPLWVQVAIDC